MSFPVLYSFRRCPYAIRARLALRYSGIAVELREVVLRDKPPELLAVSPKGTVPVLLLQGAAGSVHEIIDESLDIMFWALAQNDPDGWLEVDIEQAHHLIEANDEQFKPWLDRFKYPNRYQDLEPGEPLAQCAKFLAELEQRLSSQQFLCGSRPTVADFAIYSFVRQFAFVDIDGFKKSPYAALNNWLQLFLDAELFRDVMHKYPQWRSGDEGVIF